MIYQSYKTRLEKNTRGSFSIGIKKITRETEGIKISINR